MKKKKEEKRKKAKKGIGITGIRERYPYVNLGKFMKIIIKDNIFLASLIILSMANVPGTSI